MAVKIRLTRMGDKKSPFYRIIVADSRSPRDGKFVRALLVKSGVIEKPSKPAPAKTKAVKKSKGE